MKGGEGGEGEGDLFGRLLVFGWWRGGVRGDVNGDGDGDGEGRKGDWGMGKGFKDCYGDERLISGA